MGRDVRVGPIHDRLTDGLSIAVVEVNPAQVSKVLSAIFSMSRARLLVVVFGEVPLLDNWASGPS